MIDYIESFGLYQHGGDNYDRLYLYIPCPLQTHANVTEELQELLGEDINFLIMNQRTDFDFCEIEEQIDHSISAVGTAYFHTIILANGLATLPAAVAVANGLHVFSGCFVALTPIISLNSPAMFQLKKKYSPGLHGDSVSDMNSYIATYMGSHGQDHVTGLFDVLQKEMKRKVSVLSGLSTYGVFDKYLCETKDLSINSPPSEVFGFLKQNPEWLEPPNSPLQQLALAEIPPV